VDGTVAAYRLPYLLAGDSVVLKQDSGYYEHFYNELEPWTHYIPVSADLGDLLEKIQWARDNDEVVRMMMIMMMMMMIMMMMQTNIQSRRKIHKYYYCTLSTFYYRCNLR